METARPPRLAVFGVAAFALLCIAVALVAWRSFGGAVPLQAKGYAIRVSLPDAGNLAANADVRIAGVDVGKVDAVERDGRSVRATVSLLGRYAPLHAGARAIVRTKTLLGETYLELTRGSPQRPPIRDGSALPAGATVAAQRLDDALSAFDAPTRARLRRLARTLARGLGGNDESVNQALAWSRPAGEDLDTISRSLDAQRADLQRLLANAASTLGILGRRAGDVRTVIDAGDRVLATTAVRHRELLTTVRALPGFLTALRRTSGTLTGTSSDVRAATRSLRPVTPYVGPALRQLQGSAPEITKLLDDLRPVLRAGRAGLPAVDRVVRDVLPTLSQAHPALRELIPPLDLASASRDSIIGGLANVASTTNGKGVGPGGVVISAAGGVATLWNELIAGYKKKLPTNRSNPYPKPRSALDIANGGLKAFDCRNTGNPGIVPPLGSGVPACHVQGPWTFRGRTAYFPHLLPAAP